MIDGGTNSRSEAHRPASLLAAALALGVAAGVACAGPTAPIVPQTEAAAAPRPYASKNFQMVTDLPPGQAQELLDRLEAMLKLVSAYWGRPLPKPIQMYVVDEASHWPPQEMDQVPPAALAAIQHGGGLTVAAARRTGGGRIVDTSAVVYASAGHGSAQHEAVHAYCALVFGTIGPVWYSEGMAEVGQYWKENDKGVNAAPYVIRYLKSSEAKPLNEIVNNPLETTGDSWNNYAWRWALCHLLGFNENYTQRFRPLGLALLSGKNTNFWRIYGAQAEEIEFEFHLFLRDMEAGYRCDLCSWDWKTRFTRLEGSAAVNCTIAAGRGWQASRATLVGGRKYRLTATGTWQVGPDASAVSAAGDPSGRGRLVGAVFNDYTLSEVIELNESLTFTAPSDGKLYLRCRDNWGQLDDNVGTINVRVQVGGQPE